MVCSCVCVCQDSLTSFLGLASLQPYTPFYLTPSTLMQTHNVPNAPCMYAQMLFHLLFSQFLHQQQTCFHTHILYTHYYLLTDHSLMIIVATRLVAEHDFNEALHSNSTILFLSSTAVHNPRYRVRSPLEKCGVPHTFLWAADRAYTEGQA